MALASDGRSIKLEDRPANSAVATTSASSKRRRKPGRSFSSWLFNNIARGVIWYSLITVIFRCPGSTSDLTDTSPRICKSYITAKTYAQPYLQPYYDSYARSYVETAKPYVDQVNARVITPASVLAFRNYQKYAAPQIEKAAAYGYSQWETTLLPHVQVAQQQAYNLYETNLGPHVEKATSAAGPYYQVARDNVLDVHQRHIKPAISSSTPHLQSAFLVTQRFVLERGIPFVQHAWSNMLIFIDGTLWPLVRTVYRDNVKPQLVMISERIAKYQESRKLQSAIDEVDLPSAGTTTSVAAPTAEATETVIATDTPVTSTISLDSAENSATPPPSETSIVATDETIEADLSKWQKKFGIAAEKGTEDLRDRIENIINTISKSNIAEGESLANVLEKTAEVELDRIRSVIKAVVKTLPEEVTPSDSGSAEEEVVRSVRESGQKVKEGAKRVREWANEFDKELRDRTELAADSTLQVLDGVRDLGLQEIGIRWASMEGITYKHWEKYHGLKKQFENWRTGVQEVGLKHPNMELAHEQAQKILEETMAVTEDTAKELIRLKEAAKWKIKARDDSDNFELRAMPAAAVSAASSFVDEVQSAASGLFGGSEDGMDSVKSEAATTLSGAASSVSSYVAGTTGSAESVVSEASSYADEAMSSASSLAFGSTGTAESVVSKASSSADEALSSASSLVVGSTGTAESVLSEASSSADEAVSSASSFVLGSTGSLEKLSSSLDSAASAATDSATSLLSSLKSSAPTIGPSDDGVISSASDFIQSASSTASSVLSDATKASYGKKAESIASAASEKASTAAESLVGEEL